MPSISAKAPIAVLLALVAAGCTTGGTSISPTRSTLAPSTTTTPPRSNVDGVLRIGTLLPASGTGAALGPPLLAGVRLAVQQINAAGGVNGKPVVLVTADETGDPQMAALALEQLVTRDDVDVIIGPVSTRVTLSLLGPITTARVVACSPTSTATTLSDFPDDGYFFRTSPPDSLQARALGRAIAETGGRSAAILYVDDDYGRGIASGLADELTRQGNTVVARVALDPNLPDYHDELAAMLAAQPATIAYAGVPEPGVRVLSTLRDLGVRPDLMPVFVSDGMRVNDLAGRLGSTGPATVAGIEGTALAPELDSAPWFGDALSSAAPGVANLYAAYAYDCANLLALSAQLTGSDDPALLRAAMLDVSRGGAVCRDFPTCDRELDEGRNIDLDGASGPIEFGANGDPEYGTFDLFRFDNAGRDMTERQISVRGR